MHAGFVSSCPASHDCVSVPEPMVKHLFEAAKIGIRVEAIEPPVMVER